MEKLKVKHDHTLTDILKVCMFGLFLILPILLWTPTALYYGFNEHATAQEKIVEEPIYYETNNVEQASDLIVGNVYHFEAAMNQYTGDRGRVFISEYWIKSVLPQEQTTTTPYTLPYFYFYEYGQGVVFDDETVDKYYSFNATPLSLDFVYRYDSNEILEPVITFISVCHDRYLKEYQEVTYTMSIVDSMSNAWQTTWQTPLFSWTGNQNFQTTINAFTSVFAISQESYITNYLTYVLTLTAIYVIIDIVLSMFKLVTHLFNAK